MHASGLKYIFLEIHWNIYHQGGWHWEEHCCCCQGDCDQTTDLLEKKPGRGREKWKWFPTEGWFQIAGSRGQNWRTWEQDWSDPELNHQSWKSLMIEWLSGCWELKLHFTSVAFQACSVFQESSNVLFDWCTVISSPNSKNTHLQILLSQLVLNPAESDSAKCPLHQHCHWQNSVQLTRSKLKTLHGCKS